MATKKKKKRGVWSFLRKILLIVLLLNVGYIVVLKWVYPPITLTMLGALRDGYSLKRDYVAWNEINKYAKLAVIASEDQLFATHNGFDVRAIQKAIEYNLDQEHKKVKGASTISQQTAKNVFLWQGRDWLRKGLEVYHTFMIEWIWGKQRILELYLNVAEMGKGVFGIEAASRHYFKKSARELNKTEAAWIAAILPNPKRYSIGKGSVVARKHSWILRQMQHLDKDPGIQALLK